MARQQQQQPRGTPEEQISQMRIELVVMGFAVAKETARLKGELTGTMECPLCQRPLQFSTAPGNGHFRARCATPNCINCGE